MACARPGRRSGVVAAVDVHYPVSGGARAAAVLATDVSFTQVVAERLTTVRHVLPYRPGEFYLRELPPLRALLASMDVPRLVVIDGYVDLDPRGRPGLGSYLYSEFGVPVIGVAKSHFHTATHAVPVRRGASNRPLFVTAAGMPRPDAADLVLHMTGRFRVPDPLRRADALARSPTR
jgi:deoxyribonuclease V